MRQKTIDMLAVLSVAWMLLWVTIMIVYLLVTELWFVTVIVAPGLFYVWAQIFEGIRRWRL